MAYRRWYATWWGVLLILFVALMLTAGVLFGWQVKRAYDDIRAQALQGFNADAAVDRFRTVGPYADLAIADRPWLGADQPKVTIVEFFDFNCPVCRASYPTIRAITATHPDDVRLIMRHFPVIADSSFDLALASECAHKQGLFWNLHDRFFQTTTLTDNIGALARQSGVNMSRFNTCLQEQAVADTVTADLRAAQAIGARGTPTWLINGHLVSGQIPHDVFIQIIDALVK